MFKAVATFGRKKTSRPFKEYYHEWFNSLEKTILPQLREVMSSNPISPSLLSIHVTSMLQHFQDYYDALDLAASDDVAQVLYPEWRNAIEKPFLWLGDLHPYLFTNLLRSFLDDGDEEEEEETGDEAAEANNAIELRKNSGYFEKPYDVVMAYRNPSKNLTTRVDQIECGLRLMVPALVGRARNAQAAFVTRVGAEYWGKCEGKKEAAKGLVGEAVEAEMEELAGVFMDANRLRRSVLSEILSVTSVYQAAVFLEGLAQFLVGFKSNKLLREFHKCKMATNNSCNFLN